ncbi:MAG: hypothetical protein NT166_23410 [Candidatus Aminicenantes bacterium]|nr:hypothetical protein [Candidatus Aminicenantes bacterium]
MKTKKLTLFRVAQICLIGGLTLVLSSCGGEKKVGCLDTGGITPDFSSLPPGPLAMFTVDNVDGIRLYRLVKREGASLWCIDGEELPPGSGNRKDAAVMLLFHKLPCKVSVITAEVHGHGHVARMVAAQPDGTTQTAICPGDKRVLTLHAEADNHFIYAILSGQEAEWLKFRLE